MRHPRHRNPGDSAAFIDASERLTQSLALEGQRLAGAYLLYLLQYRVIEILGYRPTREDLHRLSDRATPKHAGLLQVEASLLEDRLRTTFKFPSPQTELKGGRFAVSSSAALGVLLDKTMKPFGHPDDGGLTPADLCVPDDVGVIWFHWWGNAE